MDIMARNMPMLLLNLKQILFVQLMLMSKLLKTWKSLKANMKKCYSEKFSIKWLFVCPGRRLMPVLVPFGTPDKQEAPHHPTHHFDLDIWTDLLMTIITFLWQVEQDSHPWTEKCQIIGHHYYHYRSHTRHMWTVQHHLGTHEPFVCVRCLGTAPGPSGITIQSDKLAKVSTDSRRVQFSASTV